ncbi:MAG: energy transducer TonB [Chthoniobacterales bacterium]
MLASGNDSLVNRINVKELLEKGQKDGAVQFAVNIGPDGQSGEAWTYRPMPGSDELEKEVLKELDGARFTPPIYNHQPVTAILYGTVVFDAEDTPHLKVLLNQDAEEIKAGSDFIGPQPVIGGDSQFTGLNLPEALPVAIEGVVDVELDVNAEGRMLRLAVVNQDPPLLGFGEAVLKDFKGAKFVPAFRDGDATESRSVMSICYKPIGVEPEPQEPLQLQAASPSPSP